MVKTLKNRNFINVIFLFILLIVAFGMLINKPNNFTTKADSDEITVYLYDGYSDNLLGTLNVTIGENFNFFVPTRANYSFLGWKYQNTLLTSSNGEGLGPWTINTSSAVINASWQPDSKTIQFDSGDTSISVNDTTIDYGTRIILPHDFSRDGYAFLGWYDSPLEAGIQYSLADGTMVRDWDKESLVTTLYAKWSLISYTITYNLDGGVNSLDNPTTYSIEDETIILSSATKQDYRFMGWHIDGIQINYIPTGSFGDLTISAIWEHEYMLTFTANNLLAGENVIDGQYATISGIFREIVLLPDVNFGGFILKCGNSYYAQGSLFTVVANMSFELVEKNRSQLYDSSTGYYDVWTFSQFNTMPRAYINSNYRLKANIQIPEDTIWTPFPFFYGIFDGNNHYIKGLNITYGLSGPQTTISRKRFGLFENNYGVIENIRIIDGKFNLNIFTATYTATPIYCGIISAENNGTISNCNVSGSFFQFSYVMPNVISYSGAICGYNTGLIEDCEIYKAQIEITAGFSGGIVGYNYYGTITNCEISLATVSCYRNFDGDNSNGYPSEHYGASGGIVGYSEGGSIANCCVASNVYIIYNGSTNDSRTLAPELGIIAGRCTQTTSLCENTANGDTGATNSLQVITWTTGFLWWSETHTWNQSQYVGGEVGRYV